MNWNIILINYLFLPNASMGGISSLPSRIVRWPEVGHSTTFLLHDGNGSGIGQISRCGQIKHSLNFLHSFVQFVVRDDSSNSGVGLL